MNQSTTDASTACTIRTMQAPAWQGPTDAHHPAGGWRIYCVEVSELSTNKQHTHSRAQIVPASRNPHCRCVCPPRTPIAPPPPWCSPPPPCFRTTSTLRKLFETHCEQHPAERVPRHGPKKFNRRRALCVWSAYSERRWPAVSRTPMPRDMHTVTRRMLLAFTFLLPASVPSPLARRTRGAG